MKIYTFANSVVRKHVNYSKRCVRNRLQRRLVTRNWSLRHTIERPETSSIRRELSLRFRVPFANRLLAKPPEKGGRRARESGWGSHERRQICESIENSRLPDPAGVCMCVRALETTWPRLLCLGVSAESTKGYPYLIKLLLRIDCQTWGPTAAAGEIIEVPRSLSRSLDPHGRNECLLSNLANFQLNLAFFASRVSSPVMYIQPFANNFSSRLKVATISPNWKHVRDLT